MGNVFAKWVEARMNARNDKLKAEQDMMIDKLKAEQDMMIDMDPEIAEIFKASQSVSGK